LKAVNTSGVSRLTKFYTTPQKSSQGLVEKIFSLISPRSQALCNFLDAPELDSFLNHPSRAGEKLRIIYRNYATLYFVFVVDSSESELGILDLIQVLDPCVTKWNSRVLTIGDSVLQVFVEALDRAFENVCELDLVFNFDEASLCPLDSPRIKVLTRRRHITSSQRWSRAALCSKRVWMIFRQQVRSPSYSPR
jgi:AP-3 complex subunit sigma